MLATTNDTIFLNVIVIHDASGSSSADQRATELSGAMSWLSSNVKTPGNYLFMGDFNTQSASEACFQSVINPTDTIVKFFDPPNQLGNWAGSPTSFAKYLTQSTRSTDIGDCGSSNTMLTRFDHILCTNPIMRGTSNIKYLQGTFNVVGQDGLHTGKSLIDPPTNVSVPADVLNALYNMSEHLPVQLKLVISKQNPLPIGLVITNASFINNLPVLQWQNNYNATILAYNIEKSADGVNFSRIETVLANNIYGNYGYTDNSNNNSEVIYYRIKQISKDGSYTYSKIKSLHNLVNEITINITPNPVKESLKLSIQNLTATNAIVYVLNSCGQTSITQNAQLHIGNNSLFINSFGHLPKGVYVLKIQTNKELISKVFIKD
jgi:hypothetical protein